MVFLESANYSIVDTNVRLGNAEIDIIAWDNQLEELVFVEVKTRSSREFGHPSHAVNRSKLRSLQYVARQYCALNKIGCDYRFDLITILPDTIDHYHNITWGMVE